MRKMFLSVGKRSFQTYLKDALRSMSECCVAQIIDAGSIDLLEAPTERYENHEEVELF